MERRWALADSPDASGRTTPKAMTDVEWLGRNGRVVVPARREIAHCFNHSLLGCAGAVHKLSLGHQGRRQGRTGPTDPAPHRNAPVIMRGVDCCKNFGIGRTCRFGGA